MKIRLGFVSNSSSSSFVCEVCGCIESGYDSSLDELGMIECEHGHLMCQSHIHNQIMEQLEDYQVEIDGCKQLKETVCPMCSFKSLSEQDELRYYRTKLKTSNKDTLKDMVKKFKTYSAFKKYIS